VTTNPMHFTFGKWLTSIIDGKYSVIDVNGEHTEFNDLMSPPPVEDYIEDLGHERRHGEGLRAYSMGAVPVIKFNSKQNDEEYLQVLLECRDGFRSGQGEHLSAFGGIKQRADLWIKTLKDFASTTVLHAATF